MKPNIDLHIEELVLHGFSPHDRWRIADAIRQELADRFAGGELPHARDLTLDRLDAGDVALAPGTAGGRVIGGAIHSAIGGNDAHTGAMRRR